MKIQIDAIKISQPIGDFFYGKINAKLLTDIAEADVRRLENEERGIETYLGIQRPLKGSRVNEIREYISSVDSTFPNSIIIAINEEEGIDVSWENNKLTIEYDESKKNKIANILDGQHRLAGFNTDNSSFSGFDGSPMDFELLITVFVNADMSVQAKVFSMVNQNQTKVNKSLVYDLESLSKSRSPWRTCHLIAVYLNTKEQSPFYHRIKRLGVKTRKNEPEPLTQAAFVDNLVKLISPAPQDDRNFILSKDKGIFSFNSKKPNFVDEQNLIKFPFRKAFLEDKDEIILKVIFEFFNAVGTVWQIAWSTSTADSVLNKTVGLIALMRLLGEIASAWLKNGNSLDDLEQSTIAAILRSTKIEDEYFSNQEATSKTGVKIFHELKEAVGSPFGQ